MTAHNWPIGEPIKTDVPGEVANVLFIDGNGFMVGHVNIDGALCARQWMANGKCVSPDKSPNLIPPKRKPRTMEVLADYENGVVHGTIAPDLDRHDYKFVTQVITHPDDIPPPITLKDIEGVLWNLGDDVPVPEIARAIYSALIESRQNNPEDRG